MKKLLLLLLLSLSFGVSAYTITYDNMGRGSDGSECRISFNKLECDGIRYSQSPGLKGYFTGDDGRRKIT